MRRLKPDEQELLYELAQAFPQDLLLRLSDGRYYRSDASQILELREVLESAFCDSGLDVNDAPTERGKRIEALIEWLGPEVLDDISGR